MYFNVFSAAKLFLKLLTYITISKIYTDNIPEKSIIPQKLKDNTSENSIIP